MVDTMNRLVLYAALSVTSVVLSGCAGGSKEIRARFDELDMKYQSATRSNAALRSRLDDVENKVLLLQDELETQRLVGMRGGSQLRQPAADLPVVKLSPASEGRQSTDIGVFDYVAGSDSTEPDYEDYQVPEDTPPFEEDAGEEVVDGGSLDIGDTYSSIDDMGRVVQSGSAKARKDSKPSSVARAADKPQNQPAPAKQAKPRPVDRKLAAARALDEYKAAYALYNDGKIDDARAAFIDFVDRYPTHAYADNARYWVGECWYDVREYEKARAEFMKVVSDYPDGNKVPDAMVKVGLCDQNLGRADDARRMYDAVILTYPDSDAAGVAMKFMDRLK